MQMDNLAEYSGNYYRNNGNDSANKNNDANNYRANNNKATTNKYFEYKTKLTRSAPNNNNRLNAEVVNSLKNLK